MPGGQYIALSGMRTRIDQLDRLASDIANVSTAGYKAERGSNVEADRSPFDSVLQTAIDVTSGDRRLDIRPGAIDPTGRPLDVAIEGAGFFTVETPAGTRYTRNGRFQKTTDGTLATMDGAVVQGTDGPINIGSGRVQIETDGTVKSDNKVVGKLAIVEFADPNQLVREGNTALRNDGPAPVPATQTTVRPGSLEQSNVTVVDRVAEMINVSRTFEALQKGVSVMMNDVYGQAIAQLGKR